MLLVEMRQRHESGLLNLFGCRCAEQSAARTQQSDAHAHRQTRLQANQRANRTANRCARHTAGHHKAKLDDTDKQKERGR